MLQNLELSTSMLHVFVIAIKSWMADYSVCVKVDTSQELFLFCRSENYLNKC